MKRALITGINGQDGSYLAEYLLNKNYKVFGGIRRHSVAENQDIRIKNLDVETIYFDMNDEVSLFKIIKSTKPDEIYNLAAMSHVGISNFLPSFTLKTNSNAIITLIEFINELCPEAKFYQASSSEMFGNSVDKDGFQRITTPMKPVSPYGCSKLLAYNITRYYRLAFNKFYVNGILFNHESPRRGSNFVTNKIIKTLIEIKKGTKNKLFLGNIDSKRDWGHAKDYVKAMHLIMSHDKPKDWVVATGETRSIRDFCKYAFGLLDLNYEDYVNIEKKYIRPVDIEYLRGDSSDIRDTLGWKPEYSFEKMIEEMLEYWLNNS